jgi:hypothetical protein
MLDNNIIKAIEQEYNVTIISVRDEDILQVSDEDFNHVLSGPEAKVIVKLSDPYSTIGIETLFGVIVPTSPMAKLP